MTSSIYRARIAFEDRSQKSCLNPFQTKKCAPKVAWGTSVQAVFRERSQERFFSDPTKTWA